MPRKIEISHKTIIFTLLLLGAIWFVWQIQDIVLILFVSLLVMTILNPIAKKLTKYKIPKALSVLVIYFLIFGVLIISLISVIPALVDQTTTFASGLPTYIENLRVPATISDQISAQVISRVGDLPGSILNFGIGIVSNIVVILTTLTFAFYLLMARDRLDSDLAYLLGKEKAKEVDDFFDELEIKLGGWAIAQIILMLSVGILYYLGFRILGIPYALPVAILAGFLEIVPYIGPILGALPGVLISFGLSPVIGIAAIALMFLVQQLENYVLVPKIMEKSVGVAPIITLLALAVGLKIAGIPGVLVSVPVVITLQVLVKRHFLI